jgi:DDE family transposase
VKTKSGATAVQVVWSSQHGSRSIERIGSAHDEAELEALKAAARQKIAAGQLELDLGLQSAGPAGPLPVISSRMGHLLDVLDRGCRLLGLDEAAGGGEVFRLLVAARIIEPVSKLDSLRVLEEAGVAPPSYATVRRRVPAYAKEDWRQRLSEACAAHARLGPASLVLYDVSALYFEIDEGDGFREPGFSKERRLEPQITIGLLADQSGFPLMLPAFEGNKAETKTMLPVIEEFMAAHQIPDVTVVADAGMISDANMKAIEDAGLSFILGMKVPDVPYVIDAWRREHPGEEIPDGHVFTQPWPAGPKDKRRDQVIYCQYRAGRARRTLHGIDEQVKKAQKAVDGQAQQVHRPGRRGQERQPGTGGEGPHAGRHQGVQDQPGRHPGRRAGHRGLRDQLMSRALADREKLQDVEVGPAGQARLPPQARLHRSPPHCRVRRPGRLPLDRGADRLVDQEVRQDRPPLPRDQDPGRPARPDRRRSSPRRPPRQSPSATATSCWWERPPRFSGTPAAGGSLSARPPSPGNSAPAATRSPTTGSGGSSAWPRPQSPMTSTAARLPEEPIGGAMNAQEGQRSAEGTAALIRVFTPAQAAEALRSIGLDAMTACALRTRAYRKQIPFHLNGHRIIFTIGDLREIAEGQARRPEEPAASRASATSVPPKPRRQHAAARSASPADASLWRARQVRHGQQDS